MFDNLRQDSSSSPLFQEEESEERKPGKLKIPFLTEGRFLGMTAPQRFVIALLLFLMVCVLGSFFLLVTDKLFLPF